MGRKEVFTKHYQDGKRMNLFAEEKDYKSKVSAVAAQDDQVISWRNHDIYSLNSNWWFTGIGHLSYRENLDLIMRHIDFRF